MGSKRFGCMHASAMAGISVTESGPAVVPSSINAKRVPKYCVRLAEALNVANPCAIRKIFDELKQLATEALRQMQPFSLYGIATFRRQHYRAKAAGTRIIRGHEFKVKPQPVTWRVNCTPAHGLVRAVLATASSAPKALTPGAKALCEKLASSIGEDISPDLVGKVMLALQSIIIGDLRAMGCFVLDGIVRFTRSEVKARPAEYVHTKCGKVILLQAKGAQQRIYGRVP